MRLSLNAILFNAAGIGVLLFVGGYMINSAFHTEETAGCHLRYGNGQQFSLQSSNGRKLTNIELQARLPVREWGLLDSARVVEAQEGKAQYLQVALGPVAGNDQRSDETADALDTRKDGVGFVWAPSGLDKARVACLSYRVFLPKDFSFDAPGKLPGLYATREIADLDDDAPRSGFVSRLGWQKGGGIGVALRTPGSPETWFGARKETWPVGRWVSIEQEVTLGSAGRSDGLLRIWIDGVLRIEKTGLNLGMSDQDALSGVVADLGYDRKRTVPGRLTISPFILQGQ